MKKTLILGMMLGSSLFGAEHEIRNLIKRQDDQTVGFIFAMGVIAWHGLLKNSEQVCSTENPYCWKVLAPMAALPALGGLLIYRKFCHIKG